MEWKTSLHSSDKLTLNIIDIIKMLFGVTLKKRALEVKVRWF